MLDIHAYPGPGSAIRTELVGDHHARCAGLLSYQLAQELLRCAPALTALNQSVQNKAVSIDGANMALPLAVDRDHDLVERRCCTKNSRVATRPCPLASGDTHRNRPAQFVHAVESFDGYSGFGLALRMAARSQRVAQTQDLDRTSLPASKGTAQAHGETGPMTN